jgi:hypothetical protein|tara:strand:- start:35 stop:217 length:183 start_codon:yes stop_codon:yes gene_type:complete
MKKLKWKTGDKVICNGFQGVVREYYDYDYGLVIVYFWQGSRYVGSVCTGENEIYKGVDYE